MHHDHLGISAERNIDGDNIYNGAVDNASGTAGLLTIAKAFCFTSKTTAFDSVRGSCCGRARLAWLSTVRTSTADAPRTPCRRGQY